ncbi:MAG: 3-oxoacyl-ACP synthase, partial [Rhodospirillaceae bacterium]|nr:3-oxoacyl-ACP synthase [Rhodospirillaceae bacterium]
MNIRRSFLVGCGAYLPQRIVDNDELAELVDTSNDWIVKRTGIMQRHIAAEEELTSDLAINAAQKALAKANLSVDEIDLIVVATTTPDDTFPSTATKVQAALGVNKGAAFDIQAV